MGDYITNIQNTSMADEISYHGEVTEGIIARLINNSDTLHTTKKIKSKIKVVLIEICSNIITHHSGSPHTDIYVKADEEACKVSVSNYMNKYDYEIIEKTIEELKVNSDTEEYYFNKLAQNTDYNHSAKLGLVRVFKLCSEFNLEKEYAAGKIRLTYKLTIHD